MALSTTESLRQNYYWQILRLRLRSLLRFAGWIRRRTWPFAAGLLLPAETGTGSARRAAPAAAEIAAAAADRVLFGGRKREDIWEINVLLKTA